MITRLAVWPRRLVSGTRLYRRTPAALRRPEPLARMGAVVFALWFGGMFLALGLLTRRSVTAATAPLPPLLFHSYFLAAGLGVIGLGFLLTRRYRVGLGLMAGMLALGQMVTIAAVV
jgi:hypothetical protein